ncbi:hypothetical protein GOP47_0027249 [Adiantum capillus-veneris]|nr:hypothetical protein GOP47_0027249 [Adiantum capillus-veneris]
MEPPLREVGIIGAGMTGLCACKHLLQHGFKPTVLEARDCVGGIWRYTCSITKLQTSRDGYQFSDFLWPQDRILFNCKVVEIKSMKMNEAPMQSGLWGSNGTAFDDASERKVWQVLVHRRKSPVDDEVHEEWLQFDFLVICVGRFGDRPKYPEFPPDGGPEFFSGKVLHSMEYGMMDNQAARQMLTGKRVVSVGFMKSAIEIALEASMENQGPLGHPCHLIYRTSNWVFVNKKFFGKLVSLFFFTRFSELMNRKPGQGWLLDILSTCLSPLKWACSKFIELYLLLHLPLQRYGLVPKHSFSKHAYSCKSYLLPDEFFPSVDKGEIILHKTSQWNFRKDGIVLHDGTFIPADIVILGTGYDSHKKLLSMVPDEYSSSLLDPSGVVPLYRGTIHPRIPHMAILGYQLKFSHIHSSEMSARWLAYFLKGRVCVPNVMEMEKDAQEWIKHMRSVSPFPHQACLGSAGIWHSDEMCRDMGWNPWRKKGLYQEFFSPYSNMDYKDK